MIAFLRGKIIAKLSNAVILEVNDIGYEVFVGENFLGELTINKEVEVYLHHHVREEASDLYGFKTLADLEVFKLLLSVSGVGPKSAIGVLSIASASDVSQAILRGDANLLTKVAGIGKKTAARIVLELKNKISRTQASSLDSELGTLNYGSDEIDALMSLGYSLSEARSALGVVSSEITDSGERVKQALKNMKKS
ncbi:MAG: Holliday junction branch migration protein RuvA [Patescibacteria group bacterium]|jgi:Holliday junction DNA helicase RuvA|nr:Holliday junction branch migration protein RuvA [bacterium]HQC49737.1 Holliday junction branch migration protein RuvA [bacterium]